MFADLLLPGAELSASVVEDAVKRALEEDLSAAGDITSAATIPANEQTIMRLVVRKPGVIAGIACAAQAFRAIDPNIFFDRREFKGDGRKCFEGEVIAEIGGPARAVLAGERVALNFVGHLSGIATLTAAYVAKVAHTKAKILDTRKTLPGLRALEKYAVRCGGGFNHRIGLYDAVLIKDNHIAVAGGVAAALQSARAAVGPSVTVEIEVDSLDQLAEVLKAGGADIVLLDNMDVATLTRAVEMARGKALTEASGGVNLETVAKIAETGVDRISVGALTHSAPALDVALDVIGKPGNGLHFERVHYVRESRQREAMTLPNGAKVILLESGGRNLIETFRYSDPDFTFNFYASRWSEDLEPLDTYTVSLGWGLERFPSERTTIEEVKRIAKNVRACLFAWPPGGKLTAAVPIKKVFFEMDRWPKWKQLNEWLESDDGQNTGS